MVTTRNEIAVAPLKVEASVVANPELAELPNKTPNVAMAFSFAGNELMSATVNRQSNPISFPTGVNHFPNIAR